jgi:hypothetical protein
MAYFGFLFKENNCYKILVFENDRFDFNFVCGFCRFVPDGTETFLFENQTLKKIKISGFRYARISMSDKNLIEPVNNIVWVNAKLYKKLRSILDEWISVQKLVSSSKESFEKLISQIQ